MIYRLGLKNAFPAQCESAMQALDLAKALQAKRGEIINWDVLVADVADLENPVDSVSAYRIEHIELDEPGKEINIFIQYPDRPDGAEKAMSGEQFLDRLLPLARDNPSFAVEASMKVSLEIEGQRWERLGMPLREIVGCIESRMLLLGVEGLNYLSEWY